MKIKPFDLWAVVDGNEVVALKTSRAEARMFASDWSHEIMPLPDRQGHFGMVLVMYGALQVRKVRVSQ